MVRRMIVFFNMSFLSKLRALDRLRNRLKVLLIYKWMLSGCGKNTSVGKPLLWTPEYITLGENVSILPDCRIEGISEYAGHTYIPEIVIGNGVSFQQRCHVTAAGRLIIDAGATILFDVVVTDIDHEYQTIGCNILHQTLSVSETYVGENCFVGAGAKILAGTRLGQQCIVGANSVVRGIFPDFCVLTGAPAVIVKRYNPISTTWEKTNKHGDFLNEFK